MDNYTVTTLQNQLINRPEMWHNHGMVKAVLNDLLCSNRPFMNLVYELFATHQIVQHFVGQTPFKQQLVAQLAMDTVAPKEALVQAVDFWSQVFTPEVIASYQNATPQPGGSSTYQGKPSVLEQFAAISNMNIQGANADNQIVRGNLALEDGEFENADQYFEIALAIDATLPEAHLGKWLAENHLHSLEEVTQCTLDVFQSKHYRHALHFVDDNMRQYLENLEDNVRQRIRLEFMKKTYREANVQMELAKANKDLDASILCFRSAIVGFKQITEYMDAADQLDFCTAQMKLLLNKKRYQQAIKQKQALDYNPDLNEGYVKICRIFSDLGDYQDAPQLAAAMADVQEYIRQKKSYYQGKDLLTTAAYAPGLWGKYDLYQEALVCFSKAQQFPYTADEFQKTQNIVCRLGADFLKKSITQSLLPVVQNDINLLMQRMKQMQALHVDPQAVHYITEQTFYALNNIKKQDILSSTAAIFYTASTCVKNLGYQELADKLFQQYQHEAEITYNNAKIYAKKGKIKFAIQLYQLIPEYKDSAKMIAALMPPEPVTTTTRRRRRASNTINQNTETSSSEQVSDAQMRQDYYSANMGVIETDTTFDYAR